ncbi:hypothetical protein [Streptomyces mirabilis]|uniref:hypothetical protein n=1 Tax=Streptomyces mirabilis TaxID=68239 RepID=UPI003698E57F
MSRPALRVPTLGPGTHSRAGTAVITAPPVGCRNAARHGPGIHPDLAEAALIMMRRNMGADITRAAEVVW